MARYRLPEANTMFLKVEFGSVVRFFSRFRTKQIDFRNYDFSIEWHILRSRDGYFDFPDKYIVFAQIYLFRKNRTSIFGSEVAFL